MHLILGRRAKPALLEGDAPTALRLMPESLNSARLSGYAVREHITLIAHALAAACNDRHDAARALLEQVLKHPMFAVCGLPLASMDRRRSSGITLLRRGDRDETSTQLRLAFGVARDYGFRHAPLLFICSDMMPRLVATALTEGIEPEIARDLVARHQLKAPPGAGPGWPWAVRVRALGGRAIEAASSDRRIAQNVLRPLVALRSACIDHAGSPLSNRCRRRFSGSRGDAAYPVGARRTGDPGEGDRSFGDSRH